MSCEGNWPLYPLRDGRFHLLYGQPIGPLLVGSDYVLAVNPLADFLAARNLEQVDFRPATLHDGGTGKDYRTHQQIVFGEASCLDDRDDLPTEGERLLLVEGALFVSPLLKEVLAASPFTYLEFSEGFRDFPAWT